MNPMTWDLPVSKKFWQNIVLFRDLLHGQPASARAMVVKSTMTTADEARWPQVQAAFEYFSLDPENPEDRELLLLVLCLCAFESRPPIGRRLGGDKWDWDQYSRLGLDWWKLLADHPELQENDSAAARRIYDQYPEYGDKGINPETIRQRLPRAKELLRIVEQYRKRPNRTEL